MTTARGVSFSPESGDKGSPEGREITLGGEGAQDPPRLQTPLEQEAEWSVAWEGPGGLGQGWRRVPEPQLRPQRSKGLTQAWAAESLLPCGVRAQGGDRTTPWGSRVGCPAWLQPLLTSAHSDIKEVANVCNQSLMKLVTPEDDEPNEPRPVVQKQAGPNPEDCAAKQEGPASGE